MADQLLVDILLEHGGRLDIMTAYPELQRRLKRIDGVGRVPKLSNLVAIDPRLSRAGSGPHWEIILNQTTQSESPPLPAGPEQYHICTPTPQSSSSAGSLSHENFCSSEFMHDEEPEVVRTTLVDFIPSLHGAERRLQRGISPDELQNAVKYGTKEKLVVRQNGKVQVRYKYTFADVVYITDKSSTREITSWAKPMPFLEMSLTSRMQEQHDEARRRLALNPGIMSSHTIFIVDQSGSMRKSDVKGHRSRSTSVFWNIANNFLAPQLMSGALKATDVISVVFLHQGAQTMMEREPSDWCTFNKIVEMGKQTRAGGHGCYIPALQQVQQLIARDPGNSRCGLAVFFLSDGKPSDGWLCTHASNGERLPSCDDEFLAREICRAVDQQIDAEVRALCHAYKERLLFHAVGFAGPEGAARQFAALQYMARNAVEAGCAQSRFDNSVDAEALKHALSTLLTSTSTMRTTLGNQKLGAETRTLKPSVQKAAAAAAAAGGSPRRGREEEEGFREGPLDPAEWVCHTKRSDDASFTRRCVLRRQRFGARKRQSVQQWQEIDLQSRRALGFGVSRLLLGEGAERLVFEMFEVDYLDRPVGRALVAKASRFVEDDRAEMAFQEGFVNTQGRAQRLAERFNRRLDQVGMGPDVPRLRFLECSVYEYYHHETGDLRAYLAERRLDPAYIFKKWNDNDGWVDGAGGRGEEGAQGGQPGGGSGGGGGGGRGEEEEEGRAHERKLAALSRDLELFTLEEGEEEEEDSEEEEEEEEEQGGGERRAAAAAGEVVGAGILDDDVPQAFSHFTYAESRRRLIVVDLQGVLNRRANAFELTDPCIHRADGRVRRGRSYGRTDKGSRGIVAFFRTHRCNPCCAAMGLAGERDF